MIAEGRLERTIPIQFSLGEGLDVGMDIGSPVDFTYELPFAFTGKIERITVDLGKTAGRRRRSGPRSRDEQELIWSWSSPDTVVLATIERSHMEVGGLPAQDWALPA